MMLILQLLPSHVDVQFFSSKDVFATGKIFFQFRLSLVYSALEYKAKYEELVNERLEHE